MKKVILFVVGVSTTLAIGFLIGQKWTNNSDMSPTSATSERKVLYYKAPMDPNYRRDIPGKSPMGMDLVPVYADEVNGTAPGGVTIDPTVVNNLGVRSAAVEKGVLSRRIETVGYIGYNEDSLSHIHTRVEGWIEKLTVKATGDPVKSGQTLFELYSPTLVNAQEEYLAVLKSRNTMLHQASRERLAALGVSASEIKRLDEKRSVKQRIRVRAQSGGVVAQLGVREGMYITPATEVMSIAELNQVWVLIEVFERQAAWVKSGQRAEVILDYLPDDVRLGTVDYVYPELDPKTRTLKVRVRLDNTDNALRPNMFARVTILNSEENPVVHIPQEALIRGGTGDRVVLSLGDGRFRVQAVEVGMESGDRVEIRSGLSKADRVVTSGQFLIDSESNIESALSRMDESIDEPEHDHSRMDHSTDKPEPDHSRMNHSTEEAEPDHSRMNHSTENPELDHSRMNHSTDKPELDHSRMNHSTDKPEPDHSRMNHSTENPEIDHSRMNHSTDKPEPDHSHHDMETMK